MRKRKKLKLWEAERSGENFLHGRFTALSFSGETSPEVRVCVYIYIQCMCVYVCCRDRTHTRITAYLLTYALMFIIPHVPASQPQSHSLGNETHSPLSCLSVSTILKIKMMNRSEFFPLHSVHLQTRHLWLGLSGLCALPALLNVPACVWLPKQNNKWALRENNLQVFCSD